MSLRTVFLVFMEMDTFRNVGIREKGIFKYRIKPASSYSCHVLYCNSQPCIKSNVVDNCYIRESSSHYKPCSIDYTNNIFTSRQFSLTSDFEEVSLRDIVCWRIENDYTSLGSISFEFDVELVSCIPHDVSSRYLSECTKEDMNYEESLIGTQHIVISNVGAEVTLQCHSLLFQKKGICEIKGLSSCCLADIRYDHELDQTVNTKPFMSYLFEGLSNSEEVKTVYKEFNEITQKCMEISYNSIKKLVQEICDKYILSKDEPLEHIDDFVNPSDHYQHVLTVQMPETHVSFQTHQQHLSDCYLSPKKSHHSNNDNGAKMNSSVIAFAKSQTMAVAEVKKYETTDSTLPEGEISLFQQSESPRDSSSPQPLENDHSNSYPSEEEPTEYGYYDYDDFEDDPIDLQASGSHSAFDEVIEPSPITYSQVVELNERYDSSNLSQLKCNLASRISYCLTASSSQIWVVFHQLTSLIMDHVTVIVVDLLAKYAAGMRERFKKLHFSRQVDISDVEGRNCDIEKDHRARFQAIRKSGDYLPAVKELRRLFENRFSIPARDDIRDDSFTCYFSEVYTRGETTIEPPINPSWLQPWECERCHHMNHYLLRTCEKCLIDHTTAPDFHVVFILHGYGGSPNDMNKVLDLLSFMYPLVKCVLIHKCYSNETKSLQYLANNVVEEIVTQLKQIQEDEKRPLGRISFIAHSIGGLVFRIAMNDPRLDPYKQYYHLFLSLNVPHLGISFGNYKTDIGARIMSVVEKSIQIDEISLKDNKDLRKTLLYELAKNNGFDMFKYFLLFSSYQDTYIPFYSERAEMSSHIEQSSKELAVVISEMVSNFWSELKKPTCKTKIIKFDCDFDINRFSIDSLFGKTAHINILTELDTIYTLILKIHDCFK